MTKFQIILTISMFVVFFFGLLDDIITHAANFSEFNLSGKISCVYICFVLGYWIVLKVYQQFKK